MTQKLVQKYTSMVTKDFLKEHIVERRQLLKDNKAKEHALCLRKALERKQQVKMTISMSLYVALKVPF